jgi:hypothetical protein
MMAWGTPDGFRPKSGRKREAGGVTGPVSSVRMKKRCPGGYRGHEWRCSYKQKVPSEHTDGLKRHVGLDAGCEVKLRQGMREYVPPRGSIWGWRAERAGMRGGGRLATATWTQPSWIAVFRLLFSVRPTGYCNPVGWLRPFSAIDRASDHIPREAHTRWSVFFVTRNPPPPIRFCRIRPASSRARAGKNLMVRGESNRQPLPPRTPGLTI